jgi:hypothetical protein
MKSFPNAREGVENPQGALSASARSTLASAVKTVTL